ncbi:MAG: hypothetical protein EZS28_020294 [Streblomastix strix]|uniref:Uncharacterized protein n=1 Tax=Streblomastix strix TaxID=222440 RepID=A0A5J4VPE0_9EUKA|nr:MAG: hypothetical protein EZS28_020294 [Streblomastix strix]
MSEKEQQSSVHRKNKAHWRTTKTKKALLVLEFMPKPEIGDFLADQGFVPLTFDKGDHHFIEKLDAFKIYMICQQMAFEDLTQRFPAMNNTFSKTETQLKMTYAQVANSFNEQLRFYMEHGPNAWLIANSKIARLAALLHLPSAPPSSTASSIDDSDQDLQTQQKKKSKRIEKSLSESSSSTCSSRSSIHHRTHSRMRKRRRHRVSASNSSRSIRSRSSIRDRHHNRHHHHYHRHRYGEFRKEMAKIVGVHRPSYFEPKKIQPRDYWKRSAEQNRWRFENLWLTSELAEMQPNEVSHAYADYTRAVSLAESTLIAEIHHIVPDLPPSRYLIDAYFMYLTAVARRRSIRFTHSTQGWSRNQASGGQRSALIHGHSTHDNAPYYGRCNNYRERGYRQPNDNQRAQNRERRVEQNPQ